ncbi:PRC-barrel domain-containing protein [Halobiforma nitratireducens JCM 10879]|uniref:PRC-barrel domain-containing protein n=2 Tax=Halobiforma nitratireducens TaxID=130048 RepID=M0MMC2_9EURY|nr:PRC-barrel domain-containing protein [Halobiforma nitratireducens JCM 10879]
MEPDMVEMDDTPQEITSLVGREVYSNSGVFVGEVEDLQLNVDGEAVTGLALGNLNSELFTTEAETGQGVIVPYRWVRAVGDVILVNDVVERVRDPDEQEDELVA